MNDQDGDKGKDQKHWLKEHDTIQVDLLKMKDELVSEKNVNVQKEKHREQPQSKKVPPIQRSLEKSPVAENTPAVHPQEMTIKQMLGGKEGASKKEPREGSGKEPPRLAEGQIPSSPDLNAKIANVLQLEDKLKRRKFELEKRSRGRDIPPPPTKPIIKEEKVVQEVKENIVEEAHRIAPIRYSQDEENGPEEHEVIDTEKEDEDRADPDKQEPVTKDKELLPGDGAKQTKKKSEAPAENEKLGHKEERKKKRRGIWALFGRG